MGQLQYREHYNFFEHQTYVQGTHGSGWVFNADIHTVNSIDPAFQNFFDDLSAGFNDPTFSLTMEFGYGNFWIIGNSATTRMKSSFGALSDANFLNFEIATVLGNASNSGDGYGDTFGERLRNLPRAIINEDLPKAENAIEIGFHTGPVTWITPGGGQIKTFRVILKS